MINIKKLCLFTVGAMLTISCMFTSVTKAATETIKNDRAKKFVDIVTAQKNKPYSYGAIGPSSFDCSGLIYYANGQMPSLNIDGQDVRINLESGLGRTTNDQYNSENGHYVSIYNKRPGDIVFFGGSSYNVTHEGMYLAGDTYVHAPRTSEVVKESSLSARSNTLPKVRRIEGWLQASNSWKFLVADKEVKNKWILDNNSYYYVNDRGYMEQNSWQWIDGSCYLFNGSGLMESNRWVLDQGKYYYLRANGAMQVNSWVNSNNKWYFVAMNGAMQTGWVTVNGNEYYLYNDGSMAVNTIIDGKKIGADGAVIKR